jgi:hypothetical protein
MRLTVTGNVMQVTRPLVRYKNIYFYFSTIYMLSCSVILRLNFSSYFTKKTLGHILSRRYMNHSPSTCSHRSGDSFSYSSFSAIWSQFLVLPHKSHTSRTRFPHIFPLVDTIRWSCVNILLYWIAQIVSPNLCSKLHKTATTVPLV